MLPSDVGLPSQFTEFRPHQLRAILDLAESTRRFSSLNAPPGLGKSAIYVAVSQLLGCRTLVLVGHKGLQRQVTDSFTTLDTFDVYGHNHYPCNLLADGTTCDHGPCHVGEYCKLRESGCDSYNARSTAANANITVANYSLWMSLARYSDPTSLGNYDLLVCDEAHQIDNWLTDFIAVDLQRAVVKRYLDLPLPTDTDWREWATVAYNKARGVYKQFKSSMSRDELFELTQLGNDLQTLANVGSDEPWVYEQPSTASVKLTPLWPAPYTEPYIYRDIPRVILSSATLHSDLLAHLGIPDADIDHVNLPSIFPANRRPFIYFPLCRTGGKMTAGEKSLVASNLDRLISDRLHWKGVFHTHSYQRARDYIDRSRHGNLLVTHKQNARDFERSFAYFIDAKPPCIFVSPNVGEGYDLGCANWQVIFNVPFLPPTPLNVARRKSDANYQYLVPSMDIKQKYGRVVRHELDFGETFMIDSRWGALKNRDYFEPWVKEAYRYTKTPPKPISF